MCDMRKVFVRGVLGPDRCPHHVCFVIICSVIHTSRVESRYKAFHVRRSECLAGGANPGEGMLFPFFVVSRFSFASGLEPTNPLITECTLCSTVEKQPHSFRLWQHSRSTSALPEIALSPYTQRMNPGRRCSLQGNASERDLMEAQTAFIFQGTAAIESMPHFAIFSVPKSLPAGYIGHEDDYMMYMMVRPRVAEPTVSNAVCDGPAGCDVEMCTH